MQYNIIFIYQTVKHPENTEGHLKTAAVFAAFNSGAAHTGFLGKDHYQRGKPNARLAAKL